MAFDSGIMNGMRKKNNMNQNQLSDNPRNENGIGEKELLAVSFGTSYPDNRLLTIGAIEKALEDAFPDFSIRRAFTSGRIIRKIWEQEQIAIDDVNAALKRASENGVQTLVVQPTHFMDGLEYKKLIKTVQASSYPFDRLAIGTPLIYSEKDEQELICALLKATAEYDDEETAICLMGHGTEANANRVYGRLQELFRKQGHTNYYIGTVEAAPTVDDLLTELVKRNYKRVLLRPLMVVAGDHANNDMAGNEPDSWKSRFEAAGYKVTCILEGLGSLPEVQEIYIRHAREASELTFPIRL